MEKITVKANVENLQEVIDFADKHLEDHNCSRKALMQLELVIEEIFVNIASYAYTPNEGDMIMNIEFNEEPLEVEISFIDNGVPYNPLKREDPDISLDLDERDIGGLGIFLVKNNVDELTYSYTDKKNILSLKKVL